jgi:hypothetical protein
MDRNVLSVRVPTTTMIYIESMLRKANDVLRSSELNAKISKSSIVLQAIELGLAEMERKWAR